MLCGIIVQYVMVLPQIEDIVNDYSKVHFAVINQSNVEAIAENYLYLLFQWI